MKNKFPGTHLEEAYGTAQQNRDYIRKEGKYEKDKKKETNLLPTFEEFGEVPLEQQGHRRDWDRLYEMVTEGKSNDEIITANPKYMRYISTVEKTRQILLEAKHRKTFRTLETTYRHGPTGVGKTRGVMDKYGYENVYRITDYHHPWDNYRQQDVVVFEEFRSSLKIEHMLNYLDGYPLELPCRYVNKHACYTKVFILSNLPIIQQYVEVKRDYPLTWDAFMRRITAIEFHSGLSIVRSNTCPF